MHLESENPKTFPRVLELSKTRRLSWVELLAKVFELPVNAGTNMNNEQQEGWGILSIAGIAL
ncbi:hypothetical protein CONPUDRAFT_82897, partial [Coniophora puteana RWD-64-598 SS2]